MTVNPFVFGDPVRQSQAFVGRRREVMEIFRTIEKAGNISIVGERRIGKTSLLRYIADPEIKRKNGLDTSRYLFAYLSFEGRSAIDPTGFWHDLLRRLLPQLDRVHLIGQAKQLLEQKVVTMDEIEQWIAGVKADGLTLVALFDEFDVAAANAKLGIDFFGGLRAMSAQYALSYIVASHRPLSDLRYENPQVLSSPFFNFFHRITLGGFSSVEVDELIERALVGSEICFTHADRVFIDHVAGPHPFFVQMAAYYLFDAYDLGYKLPDGQLDTRWIVSRMRDNGAEHFRYYWDNSENGEKVILASLALTARGEAQQFDLPAHFVDHPAYAQMLESLKRRVLVTTGEGGRLWTFSLLFDEWLANEVAFIASDQVDDFEKLLEETEVKGLRERWIDRTERLRRGFAWIDSREIFKKLLVEKGPEAALNLLSQLVIHYITH